MSEEQKIHELEIDLERYLDLTDIDKNGDVVEEFCKRKVDSIGSIKIEVHADHIPPHFHVSSKQKNYDARFIIENYSFLNNKYGEIPLSEIKKVQEFYRQNPDHFNFLKQEHDRMNKK